MRFSLITVLVGVIVISFVSAVSAAEITKGAAGLGLGGAPDYEGSDTYEAAPIPFFTIGWDNHMSVEWVGNKAKANLIPHPTWKAGPIAQLIPERDDVESNRVDRLGDVDTSFMFGGFFGFEYSNWSASIEGMVDVADGNDGAIIRLNGGYRIPISDTWKASIGGFTTWASDDYMEAYFEIDGVDSARSGLRPFSVDSGFKDVGLRVSGSYKPWEHWSIMGIASYTRLVDDAEDSPVTDDAGNPNQFLAGILVVYNWR
jgi:outer membrane scaffolding protein for murein synthesis (MipA/OmpV family)